MKIESQVEKTLVSALRVVSNQVVEGFISGMHKSPFHGFSAVCEHKVYNVGKAPSISIEVVLPRPIVCTLSVKPICAAILL
jgi:hypothetical protein